MYQAWISQSNMYTYRIDFTDDMLATGRPAQTSIIDYYTIVENNGEYKLNINKFVGSENINKETIKDNLLIKVKRKNIYMDYEIYDIEFKNNTQSTVILDDMKHTDNIYVEDDNELKYFWNNYEYLESDVTVRTGFTQEIPLKFNKKYKVGHRTNRIIFANVLLKNKTIDIRIEI